MFSHSMFNEAGFFSAFVLVLVLDFNVLALASVLEVTSWSWPWSQKRQSKAVSRQHNANAKLKLSQYVIAINHDDWFRCKSHSQSLCQCWVQFAKATVYSAIQYSCNVSIRRACFFHRVATCAHIVQECKIACLKC